MADGSYQLFTLAVETRAPLLAGSGAKARDRAALEIDWAQRRGIGGEILKAGSMTDSTSPQESRTPSWIGTDTDNGNDIHSDQVDDVETTLVSDDLKNDEGF